MIIRGAYVDKAILLSDDYDHTVSTLKRHRKAGSKQDEADKDFMALAFPTIRPLQHHQKAFANRPSFSNTTVQLRHHLIFACFRSFRLRCHAATALVDQDPAIQQTTAVQLDFFACPICYEPLVRKGPQGLNLSSIYRSAFKCQNCCKTYSSKDVYLDLVVTAGTKEYVEFKPSRTELFRSPLVSFLYERGWRQNFKRSGFPGLDEEFSMAQEYFSSAAGGVLIDASCGSGLFSRKFAKSGAYSGVIALDFSENMLRQCYDFIKEDDSVLNENVALVRADVSRLPFLSGSVDAVHAGAALHCWPSPSNALAEITRILRSGGVFVGTTFLASVVNSFPLEVSSSFPFEIFRPLARTALQLTNSYTYFTEKTMKSPAVIQIAMQL
ncbi:hypothetical protein H6P81_011372 [Aristolochia fimbriata]|uniref:Methyltransferase type 11 domain-containing protein n=1 Tax=Aristolochia fimbriata TaxID=158543 RepID=A0AAV7EUU1_ARIFI|nr:hypothetical protein H6P81_011372 [Aristolochia fimbriata]